MVVFNDWIDVTTFNPRRMWPWLAGQSKTNELHVCPTDAWNYTIIDPDYFLFGFRAPRPRQPVGRWRPGTFYIYLFSLSAPTGPSYHLTVELLPIAAPQPQGLDWCAAPEVDTANYECLESDVVQWGDASTLPDEFINGDGLRYYIARVEPGPCPRFFGMSVTYSLYAFVAVWISESLAFPIADEPTEEAMLLASGATNLARLERSAHTDLTQQANSLRVSLPCPSVLQTSRSPHTFTSLVRLQTPASRACSHRRILLGSERRHLGICTTPSRRSSIWSGRSTSTARTVLVTICSSSYAPRD